MEWEEMAQKYTVETLEFIKSGKDVVATQGQLYIEELIKWEIAFNLIICLICIALFIASSIGLYKAVRAFIKEDNGALFFAMLITGFVFLTSFIQAINSGSSSLKAYLAPRVVIMEKLTKAVSK